MIFYRGYDSVVSIYGVEGRILSTVTSAMGSMLYFVRTHDFESNE